MRQHLRRWWRDHNPRQTCREIKWFYQRGKRGWADCDTWGLDSHLSRVIRDSVDYLRTHTHGHPGDITEQEWEDILLEISVGMQATLDLIELNYDTSDKGQEQLLMSLHKRSLHLVKERWFSLWD
jgi:hypothetical protein